MKPIPKEFDLAAIVGTPLSQVCIGQYQIQFHFDGATIEGGGRVSLETGGTSTELFNDGWVTSSGLEKLVGEPVSAWSRRDQHHFALSFPSGVELVFETQVGPYEDFTVQLGTTDFWVL